MNRSMSMTSTNPSARYDRKTFSLSAHRKKVFGENVSSKYVDGKLNDKINHFIENSKYLKANKNWQDEILHEKGIINDDTVHNEGLSVVRTNRLKNIDIMTKAMNLFEGSTLDRELK